MPLPTDTVTEPPRPPVTAPLPILIAQQRICMQEPIKVECSLCERSHGRGDAVGGWVFSRPESQFLF